MTDRTNRGQAKQHDIYDADGNPVLNEDGSQRTMSQAEWRARDKSAGYTRDEDDDDDAVVPPEPTTTE